MKKPRTMPSGLRLRELPKAREVCRQRLGRYIWKAKSMNSGSPGTIFYLIQMNVTCHPDKEAAFLLFPLGFNYETSLKPFILTGLPPPISRMLLRVLEISLLNTHCQKSQKPSFSLLLSVGMLPRYGRGLCSFRNSAISLTSCFELFSSVTQLPNLSQNQSLQD